MRLFSVSLGVTLLFFSSAAWSDPIYPNSVVSNELEFIATSDRSVFAWAMLMHPGRLPADIEARVISIMPHRLAFFEELFLSKNYFWSDRPVRSC